MKPSTKSLALCLFSATLLCSASAQALSLMDAQEKQKQAYAKCTGSNIQLLGEPDLDGDGKEESITLYAFEDCPGKSKALTFVAVFYKTGDNWTAAKGDTVLSDHEATLYSLEGTEGGIITLKHVFDDAAPPARFQYSKGKLKRLK